MYGPPQTPVEDRFWQNVQKTESCWIWTASTMRGGYGQISEGGRAKRKNLKAHRWSYEQANGPIPKGLVIDHLCRVRLCVRPDHMEAVTSAVNCYRGKSPASDNALKIQCLRGHEFDDLNTRYSISKTGEIRRVCRECMRIRDRKRQPRNKKK